MKKLLIGSMMAVALAVAVLLPAVTANAAAAQTDVTGVVTKNGVPVAGATVTAKCMGFTEIDGTTDAAGSYLVIFTTAECPFGSTVNVFAKKGGETGTAHGTVQGITTKLNVGIVNVSIPEYGWIGGVLAAGAGVGAIAFTRRRFAGQSTSAV